MKLKFLLKNWFMEDFTVKFDDFAALLLSWDCILMDYHDYLKMDFAEIML